MYVTSSVVVSRTADTGTSSGATTARQNATTYDATTEATGLVRADQRGHPVHRRQEIHASTAWTRPNDRRTPTTATPGASTVSGRTRGTTTSAGPTSPCGAPVMRSA